MKEISSFQKDMKISLILIWSKVKHRDSVKFGGILNELNNQIVD